MPWALALTVSPTCNTVVCCGPMFLRLCCDIHRLGSPVIPKVRQACKKLALLATCSLEDGAMSNTQRCHTSALFHPGSEQTVSPPFPLSPPLSLPRVASSSSFPFLHPLAGSTPISGRIPAQLKCRSGTRDQWSLSGRQCDPMMPRHQALIQPPSHLEFRVQRRMHTAGATPGAVCRPRVHSSFKLTCVLGVCIQRQDRRARHAEGYS